MTFCSVCFLRAFDVELLYIAQQLKIPLVEVAINWKEIDGLFYVFFSPNISMFLFHIIH